jgi:hypothetical protein
MNIGASYARAALIVGSGKTIKTIVVVNAGWPEHNPGPFGTARHSHSVFAALFTSGSLIPSRTCLTAVRKEHVMLSLTPVLSCCSPFSHWLQ